MKERLETRRREIMAAVIARFIPSSKRDRSSARRRSVDPDALSARSQISRSIQDLNWGFVFHREAPELCGQATLYEIIDRALLLGTDQSPAPTAN
jgi:hypothetical protein